MKHITYRKIKLIAVIAWLLLLTISLISCNSPPPIKGKLGVAVSILPQAEFVERVGGERVEVLVMVPPGADPHTYEPLASQMIKLNRAIMYAKVGSGLEFELGWMDKLIGVNKDMLVIDCSQEIKLLHSEEDDGHGTLDQKKESFDPHIWMSPLNVIAMVRNICKGLIEVDPGNRMKYETNRDIYMQQLTQLNRDMKTGFSGIKNRSFMTFHPSFAYLAREYGLTMLTISAEGKEPTAAALAKLIEQAKKNDVKIVIVSPQFNAQSARVIADEIGGRIAIVDTLAKDYIINMRLILDSMIKAMR